MTFYNYIFLVTLFLFAHSSPCQKYLPSTNSKIKSFLLSNKFFTLKNFFPLQKNISFLVTLRKYFAPNNFLGTLIEYSNSYVDLDSGLEYSNSKSKSNPHVRTEKFSENLDLNSIQSDLYCPRFLRSKLSTPNLYEIQSDLYYPRTSFISGFETKI